MSKEDVVFEPGLPVLIGPDRDIAAEMIAVRGTPEGWLEYEVAWMDAHRCRQTAWMWAGLFDVVGTSKPTQFTQEDVRQ